MRITVQVPRSAYRRKEIIGLEGILHTVAHLECTLIEHELTTQRIRTQTSQAVDCRGHRSQSQRACTRFDGTDRRTCLADAAVHRRVDCEIADRPDIQRRISAQLADDAAGDDAVATGANKDTTAREVEINAGGQTQAGVFLHRQRVDQDVGINGQSRTGDAGQLDIVVRRNGVMGIFCRTQETQNRGRRTCRSEGNDCGSTIAGGHGGIDQSPRQDSLIGRTRRSRLTIESEARNVGDDYRYTRPSRIADIGAAEHYRCPGPGRRLRGSHIIRCRREI